MESPASYDRNVPATSISGTAGLSGGVTQPGKTIAANMGMVQVKTSFMGTYLL